MMWYDMDKESVKYLKSFMCVRVEQCTMLGAAALLPKRIHSLIHRHEIGKLFRFFN